MSGTGSSAQTDISGFITVKGHTSPEDMERIRQRYLDGEALDRLREVLPEDLIIEVTGPWTPGEVDTDLSVWEVRARSVSDDWGDGPRVSFVGQATTIAEAADKCREAQP